MPADSLTASVRIEAPPERVFPYFTEADRMVRWMGEAAQLDARPGGRFAVDVEGTAIRGEFVELDPPHRVVFTWGHAGWAELPPGASTVEVRLTAEDGGTLVELTHRDVSPARRDGHSRGWRRFLGELVGVAAAG
jgi:uncharacterized protein YndB with AHSA1/START domain